MFTVDEMPPQIDAALLAMPVENDALESAALKLLFKQRFVTSLPPDVIRANRYKGSLVIAAKVVRVGTRLTAL